MDAVDGTAQIVHDIHGWSAPVGLRIIGGQFRGRKLQYSGDPRVRPMKDRVREAVFNLVGPDVRATHAIDLFAGTSTGSKGRERFTRSTAAVMV